MSNSDLIKSGEISKLIFNFKSLIKKNFKNVQLLNIYRAKILQLCDKIEYFEIRNTNNLSKKISKRNFRIFVAYSQNKIRLIDNV